MGMEIVVFPITGLRFIPNMCMQYRMWRLTLDQGVMERRVPPIGTLVICGDAVAVGPPPSSRGGA